ncbi:uncharacterized protein LOC121878170 [Homarus americanus]|uniref:uncharacterized protein LOC121878170 n=1 Tax=Homarus americanus TaxID=6706 RepID=UPI001C494CA9|nr:uncharacterized protein LOC121878170 [Homarus americanus]
MLGNCSVEFLENVGCCRRCILIYLGDRSDNLYDSLSSVNETIKEVSLLISTENEEAEIVNQESSKLENEEKHTLKTTVTKNDMCTLADEEVVTPENGTPEHIVKKQKCAVCITCIGLLQWGCSTDAIKLVSRSGQFYDFN